MKTIGNIIWVLTVGWFLALLWFITGVLFCISIIGIPFGMQFFKIAGFALLPFGKEVIYGGKGVSFLLNLFWIIFFGWELAVSAAAAGLVLCITIIGIPFGFQAFKLAKLGLMPFGSQIKKY